MERKRKLLYNLGFTFSGLGFRDITPAVEKQMEKKMESELEAGFLYEGEISYLKTGRMKEWKMESQMENQMEDDVETGVIWRLHKGMKTTSYIGVI